MSLSTNNTTIITAIIGLSASIITAIVTIGQVKSTEKIEMAKVQIEQVIQNGKLDLERGKAAHLSNMEKGTFVFDKIKLLQDPDQAGMATAMLRLTLSEDEFKDLLTYISQYGNEKAKPIAEKTLAKTEKQRHERNLWKGLWDIEFIGSSKKYPGELNLFADLEGRITGIFKMHDSNITGKIEGRLSKNGNELNGTWKNSAGQNGKIRLALNADIENLSFSGNYSMYETEIDEKSYNKWRGSKVN